MIAPSIPAPVFRLGNGRHWKHEPWYWSHLHAAQIDELTSTFGPSTVVDDIGVLDGLPVPSILALPALMGGVTDKAGWWNLRWKLWEYRRRGGLILVLHCATSLAAENQRSRGRTWGGMHTNKAPPVAITAGEAAIQVLDTAASDARGWPAGGAWSRQESLPIGAALHLEHARAEGRDEDTHLRDVVRLVQGDQTAPLATAYFDDAFESPGMMLFVNTWGWMRIDIRIERKSARVKAADLPRVEKFFEALRRANHLVVERALVVIQRRLRQRMERLEILSGEKERLSRTMGTEKDYQRILANDLDLCLDLLDWRGGPAPHPDGGPLRKVFDGGWIWPEPPYRKSEVRRGRLDLLLFAKGEEPEERNEKSLREYLTPAERPPVAWIELENKALEAQQIDNFLVGTSGLIHPGDFVCSVDRSDDEDPLVAAAAQKAEAAQATFVHVNLRQVLLGLEEQYAPLAHRTLRKRYTLDVIRGLVG